MSDQFNNIIFEKADKGYWLRRISEIMRNLNSKRYDNQVISLTLDDSISKSDITPLHLVSFACMIKSLKGRCKSGRIIAHEDIIDFLKNDLHLDEYFSSLSPYIKSESIYNLNLWNVSQPHAMMYSQHIADYFKKNYFADKDLSVLKVILDELFANIADHSLADGIAYSFIRYDVSKEVIEIAFCDFGIGIKNSLKSSGIYSDGEYIKLATEKGISARSNSHNKGFGLDTVVSCISYSGNIIKILSNDELFVSYGDKDTNRTFFINFDFPGTLIYFDLPVSSFEDADYIDEFEI